MASTFGMDESLRQSKIGLAMAVLLLSMIVFQFMVALGIIIYLIYRGIRYLCNHRRSKSAIAPVIANTGSKSKILKNIENCPKNACIKVAAESICKSDNCRPNKKSKVSRLVTKFTGFKSKFREFVWRDNKDKKSTTINKNTRITPTEHPDELLDWIDNGKHHGMAGIAINHRTSPATGMSSPVYTDAHNSHDDGNHDNQIYSAGIKTGIKSQARSNSPISKFLPRKIGVSKLRMMTLAPQEKYTKNFSGLADRGIKSSINRMREAQSPTRNDRFKLNLEAIHENNSPSIKKINKASQALKGIRKVKIQ